MALSQRLAILLWQNQTKYLKFEIMEINMSIQPIGDMVLIERNEPDATTDGGIYLPNGSKNIKNTGKIIAVGEGKVTDQAITLPMKVKIGDNVIFNHRSGVEVSDGEYLLIPESAIYAVLT